MKTLEKILLSLGLMSGCDSRLEDTAYEDVNLVVIPQNPKDNDNIVAYVDNTDKIFDFYWVRDSITYKIETGQKSVLNAAFTEPGDEWQVYVFTPSSAGYDSYELGNTSFYIN